MHCFNTWLYWALLPSVNTNRFRLLNDFPLTKAEPESSCRWDCHETGRGGHFPYMQTFHRAAKRQISCQRLRYEVSPAHLPKSSSTLGNYLNIFVSALWSIEWPSSSQCQAFSAFDPRIVLYLIRHDRNHIWMETASLCEAQERHAGCARKPESKATLLSGLVAAHKYASSSAPDPALSVDNDELYTCIWGSSETIENLVETKDYFARSVFTPSLAPTLLSIVRSFWK